MAPISDKRSHSHTQPQLKDNNFMFAYPHEHGHGQSNNQNHSHTHGHSNNHSNSHHHSHGHGHNHTKENATTNSRPLKKSLEILDFHESWLEEMEIYKDRLDVQNKLHNLLSSRNPMFAPQNTPSTDNNKSNLCGVNNNEQRKSAEVQQTIVNNLKGRIRNRAAGGAAAPAAAACSMHSAVVAATAAAVAQQNVNLQLYQNHKRSHDEANPGKNSNSLKRRATSSSNPPRSNSYSYSTHSQSQSQSLSQTQSQSQSQSQSYSHAPSLPPGINTIKSGCGHVPTGTVKPTTKIIVNQFHASSLLNSQQHEEKTKILTQNGLTKSAATAYETSLYASNYLAQQDHRESKFFNFNGYNGGKNVLGDHSNYIGVSLAKTGESERPKGGSSLSPTIEDDPCAAIDEVNDYSESDSEDEYKGHPFYLEEDGDETNQSRNIRFSVDKALFSESGEEETSEYYKPKAVLTASIFPKVPPYLNFSSHADKGPPMPTTLHKVLKWRLSPVMPKIVKRVVLNSGFRIIKNTTDWMAVWEKHMKSPGFRTIRSHQKYNHMPGSFRIGRKDTIWRSIYANMKKFGSKEFGFMQKSYIMPDDLENLRLAWPKNASKLTKWILKPPASARGTGIRIVNKWSQFSKDRPLVVQKYIERPLLINDNKFDMRLYVIVTSINPLRIYMYKDGLARFAAVKYSSELNSLDDRCMHLTNYSINKFSQSYSKNEDFNACQGHKWTLQSLWSCLEGRGVNTKRLWATLRNLVIKSIISGESGLNRMYRQNVNFRYNCFELFGFDVLLDENLVPWLLEINISPSLHSELPLDLHVKGPLIQAVLNTALYQVPPKLNEKQQKDILDELKMSGPLCHDKRIFTTCLTAEEVRKHNLFTSRSIEFREEYVDSILDNLLPDDVRCLILTEDEYARSKPLERIFPTVDTHLYLKFVENPRYYNRLLDAWEHRYYNCREKGIAMLSHMCSEGYHLQVSEAAMEKEPNVALTEIDMFYTKKEDPLITLTMPSPQNNDRSSKSATPDSGRNFTSEFSNKHNVPIKAKI